MLYATKANDKLLLVPKFDWYLIQNKKIQIQSYCRVMTRI